MKRWILIFTLVFYLFACQNTADCFKEAGSIDTLVVDNIDFKDVKVFGIFDIFLKNSDSSYVKIITYQTLLKNIEIQPQQDTISIIDLNKCYFLRDYQKKIKLIIATNKDFLMIQNYNGSNYYTFDTLKLKYFLFKNYAYYSNLNITLKTYSSVIEPWFGFGNYKISGMTQSLLIESNKATLVDAVDFLSEYARIRNYGISDIYVNVLKNLYAEIYSSGNIYYKGNPEISLEKNGDGQLIEIN